MPPPKKSPVIPGGKSQFSPTTDPTSRMGSLIAARKRGELKSVNPQGINYNKGNWSDNKGKVFGTAKVEDGEITLNNGKKYPGANMQPAKSNLNLPNAAKALRAIKRNQNRNIK